MSSLRSRVRRGLAAALLVFAANVPAVPTVSANVPTPSSVPGAVVPYGLAWFANAPTTQPFFFGNLGDVPLYADMDGNGTEDPVVFRPSTGWWYWNPDAAGNATQFAVFGGPGDSPLLGDVDGDGRANLVIYRPSTQQFIYGTQAGTEITRFSFGNPGDQPVMGTWIDGRTSEPGLFRPSNLKWYLGRTAAGGAKIVSPQWGNAGDVPLTAKWHGNGTIEPALYRPSTEEFFVGGGTPWRTHSAYRFGNPGDTPVFGDVNGDGFAEAVAVRPAPLGNNFRVDSVTMSWDQAGTMPASLSTQPLPFGVTAWVTVRVTNTGALPWQRSEVELRTTSPTDRGSGFSTAQWLSLSRVTNPDESVIVSGGVATFRFPLSPQTWVGRGFYPEEFTVHHVPTGADMTRSAGSPIAVTVGSTGGAGIATVDSITRVADGRIRISGWAWSSTGQPATIKVSVNNVVIPETFQIGVARPDVAPLRYVSPNPGFDFYLPSTYSGLINVAAIVDATQTIADVPAYNSGVTISAWQPPTTTTTPPPAPGGKPRLTSVPTISGSPVAGNVLTATSGIWSRSPSNFWLKWFRCNAAGNACVGLGDGQNYAWGATVSRTITSADVGSTIRVEVVAENASGSSAASRSWATSVISPQTDFGPLRLASAGIAYRVPGSALCADVRGCSQNPSASLLANTTVLGVVGDEAMSSRASDWYVIVQIRRFNPTIATDSGTLVQTRRMSWYDFQARAKIPTPVREPDISYRVSSAETGFVFAVEVRTFSNDSRSSSGMRSSSRSPIVGSVWKPDGFPMCSRLSYQMDSGYGSALRTDSTHVSTVICQSADGKSAMFIDDLKMTVDRTWPGRWLTPIVRNTTDDYGVRMIEKQPDGSWRVILGGVQSTDSLLGPNSRKTLFWTTFSVRNDNGSWSTISDASGSYLSLCTTSAKADLYSVVTKFTRLPIPKFATPATKLLMKLSFKSIKEAGGFFVGEVVRTFDCGDAPTYLAPFVVVD